MRIVQSQEWIGMIGIGFRLRCQWCNEAFVVCTGCYCGQRYCSSLCSSLARLKSCREAQRRYAATDEGRENRRKLQKQYRIRKARNLIKKSVADKSSNLIELVITRESASTESLCIRCGELIFSFKKRVGRADAKSRNSI